MRKQTKKWVLNKKHFWQNFDEPNGAYKLDSIIVAFNCLMLIQDGAYEMYDATKHTNILVTKHGVVNIEKSKGDWQMYRR